MPSLREDAISSPPDHATLDPQDWDAFRSLAHRMVDDMLTHLSTLRDQPAWRAMPPAVRGSFNEPLPSTGIGSEAAYRAFVERVMPYTNGNIHPRFWGWVQGSGTPLGMMADMLAAGINPHLAGLNQAPALVEHEVLRWLAEMLGMPSHTSGLLVTGGTMANVLSLAVARHVGARAAGFDVRADGLQGRHNPLVFYASTEVHTWARKGAEWLGLGHRALRLVPVNAAFQIDGQALREMIRADRKSGLRPFCVVGTAGTVNTGAIDDLELLADIARREGLWFHVDGAFGALAYLSPALRPRVAGLPRADSLGFDLHKWGSLPFECACTLIRDGVAHREAMAMTASYLAPTARGVIAGGLPFADRGLDLTRNFRALKVWMMLKAEGVNHLTRCIEQNVRHAEYLAAAVEQSPDLDLVAPMSLNVVCLRYAPRRATQTNWDAINEEIVIQLQERGIAIPSGTVVNGHYAIRVANVNHRSRQEDFDALIKAICELGKSLSASRSIA
jgi:aromatic-L-amino-acid/L-tryptophan decarboxylase